MLLNDDYIVSKFYQFAGSPKYNRLSKAYNGSCPTCREGKSWGKKRRLYFIPKKNLIFCHNCGLSMRPVKWIQQVSGISYFDVLRENSVFLRQDAIETPEDKKENVTKERPLALPTDAINLFDKQQVDFYKTEPIVQKALQLIKQRRLDTAINRPDTLWLSLNDPIHKNRLIIPFYDNDGKIAHYQTRTIIDSSNYPKYLSKQHSEKTLFGINKIDNNYRTIFITEGPIDACFLKNGIAVAGINESKGKLFTKRQEEQLKQYPLHEQVWVLDNQYIDSASKKKTSVLAKHGCKVFLWPRELQKYKDLNEVCIETSLDSISEKFILKNTYSGMKASLLLTQTA